MREQTRAPQNDTKTIQKITLINEINIIIYLGKSWKIDKS